MKIVSEDLLIEELKKEERALFNKLRQRIGRRYLYDKELAARLQITVQSLRNAISLGDPLPPRIQIPNKAVRLWERDAADDWFSNNQNRASSKLKGGWDMTHS